MKKYSILCVDDDRNLVDVLALILRKPGYTVFTATSGQDALKILKTESVDIAIIDYKMPQMSGLDLLKKIRKLRRNIDVLILTGHGTIPNAVESIKLGAFDYILKPFHKSDILNRIEKIVRFKKLESENILLKAQMEGRHQIKNIVGTTQGIVEICKMIPNIADSESTVLILGETGTGKEEIAKAIHYSGNRSDKLFTIVDCTSINPNLCESELFGHVKGAFTGAVHDKAGLLESAGDGTLFLDEIGEIPTFIQVKLLRTIEERMVRPVGSIKPREFKARILAATSKNLQDAIEKNEFREDLFFRLNVVSVEIPPLRERVDDIPILARHFIKKIDRNRNLITGISDDAMDTLQNYNWQGNVRELENCIERAFTLGVRGEIHIKDLPKSVVSGNNKTPLSSGETTMSDHQREIIIRTLKETKGNKRKAAEVLNVGVTTLYRKLKKYGIEMQAFHNENGFSI